jgi:SAM-dependent methyltransferase
MNALLKPIVRALKWQDKKLTSISMRAMQWTGRSDKPIHPKHLYDDGRNAHLQDLFKSGHIFLDVGSGSGSDCLAALQKGASYAYGIERISSSIEISKNRLREFKGKFEIFDLNLEDAKIPLPDASVDLINFSNVLEHIVNRVPLLQELQRILKPDGVMHISIPNADTPWKKLQRKVGLDSRDDTDHKIEYTKEGLNKKWRMRG